MPELLCASVSPESGCWVFRSHLAGSSQLLFGSVSQALGLPPWQYCRGKLVQHWGCGSAAPRSSWGPGGCERASGAAPCLSISSSRASSAKHSDHSERDLKVWVLCGETFEEPLKRQVRLRHCTLFFQEGREGSHLLPSSFAPAICSTVKLSFTAAS